MSDEPPEGQAEGARRGRRHRPTGNPPAEPRQLYGRRVGKALRPVPAAIVTHLLPHLAVDLGRPIADLRALFARPVTDVRCEIGFGGGERLIAEAQREPEVGFIGCEPFVNGMASALQAIARHDLDNIRVHVGDAAALLDHLPPTSLGGIDVFYPDPWPKRRHRKRRLLSEATLAWMARVLRPGALLRFATDIDDYAAWTLARVLRSPDFAWSAERAADWLEPWPGWTVTRYESKARAAGRASVYLTFRRR